MYKVISFLFLTLLGLISTAAFSLPSQISSPGEKMIYVDPSSHRWGAYDASGRLVKSGLASAGKDFCPDTGQPCRTRTGSFRIQSLGSAGCKSPSFPIPRGGAPMQYCMYFNKTQALHGSPNVVNGNISHGCVRMHVGDARWLRYNFAQVGTLVYIGPY